jgi:hypothetical protein
VLTEGSLLGATRFGFLSPWDHDVEIMFVGPPGACLEQPDRPDLCRPARVVRAMDELYGPAWHRYLEVDNKNWGFSQHHGGPGGGCSANELIARGFFGLVRYLRHKASKALGYASPCETEVDQRAMELRQEHGIEEAREMDYGDIVWTELRSPRLLVNGGRLPEFTARVALPSAEVRGYFLNKYGASAFSHCRPDPMRIVFDDAADEAPRRLGPRGFLPEGSWINVGSQSASGSWREGQAVEPRRDLSGLGLVGGQRGRAALRNIRTERNWPALLFNLLGHSSVPCTKVLRDIGAGGDLIASGSEAEMLGKVERALRGRSARLFAGDAYDSAAAQR